MLASDVAGILAGLALVIAAIGSAIAAIIGAIVHREIKTSNGLTMGALADLAEGRAVIAGHDPRTKADQHYAALVEDHDATPRGDDG